MRKTILITFLFILTISSYAQSELEILKSISGKISKIKNASYSSKYKCGESNDTLFSSEINRFEVYTRNENDEFLKCNFYWGFTNAPNNIRNLYIDGIKKRIDWKNKKIIIDSLNNNLTPYKFAIAPILIGSQGIIDYSIENFNNIIVELNNYTDSIKIKVTFPDKVIENINYKPWIVHCPNIEKENEHSSYTFWVDNKFIPYKILREVHAERCLISISDLKHDTLSNKTILAGAYIPNEFEVVDIKNIPITKNIHPLENKAAPEWNLLCPQENKSISLNDIKSSAILLQFTGIGCGHCKEAIPFMKQLKTDYNTDKLEIISIETFNDKPEYIKHYIDLNKIDYNYLVGTKSVKDDYSVRSAPQFFILNQDKEIQKIIIGYRKDKTDKIIIQQIEKLIN